jgi:hypothetical protein
MGQLSQEKFFRRSRIKFTAPMSVIRILSNPDEDPHLFEANPSAARALADAKLVIADAADYDPSSKKPLGAVAGRREIGWPSSPTKRLAITRISDTLR